MDKVKAFFSNSITKIVSWVVLAVSSVILIIGGVTGSEISTSVSMIEGIVAAVAALIAFIAERVTKKV